MTRPFTQKTVQTHGKARPLPHRPEGKPYVLHQVVQEAIVEFEKQLEDNPVNTALLERLGGMAGHQGRLDAAIKFYKNAVTRAVGDQLFVLDEAYAVCKQVLEESK